MRLCSRLLSVWHCLVTTEVPADNILMYIGLTMATVFFIVIVLIVIFVVLRRHRAQAPGRLKK